MKRVEWIDAIKGFCIILIVLFHIEYKFWATSVGDYIGVLCSYPKVSMFFLVAGFTLSDKFFEEKRSAFRRIKKPYLINVVVGEMAVLFHNFFISIGLYKINYSYSGKIMSNYDLSSTLKQIVLTLFFGNREPIIGPMWFLNVYIIALIFLYILNVFIRIILPEKPYSFRRMIRLYIALFLAFTSIILTEYFGITIPRFSNSLVAMFLFDFGSYFYNALLPRMRNKLYVFVSVIIILCAPMIGGFAFNVNHFTNPILFLFIIVSMLVVFTMLFPQLEGTRFINIMSFIGKESLYIMCMHFLCFKILTIFLSSLALTENVLYSLTPTSRSIFELILYTLSGVLLPILFSTIIKFLKGVREKT